MPDHPPATPPVSETDLRELPVDELRRRARDQGIAAGDMRKEEIIDAISERHRSRGEDPSRSTGHPPDTPDLSETELRAGTVEQVRERARREGVEGADELLKEQLIEALSARHRR